ncbi:condensation domain-containing protein [Amycolatopsis alba]|uniref:Carrier domain-containing protein n=1 Tax=Amycolatopsis alba DSM 44262 TaxID=1125972 RepID=A0A229REB9_AMYAL|nr:condensation domain-containing protein [Amycolatopsis alba]OXM45006.1 hypothetical protein CFP75_32335 [Amycolatopsis alba DSM 44262]
MAPGSLSADQYRLLQRRLDEAGIGKAADGIPRRPADEAQSPASHAQERLYFFEQLNPDSALYVVAGTLRMRGEVDVAALRESVRVLVERHEALRTGLRVDDEGGVVQIVHPPEAVTVDVPFAQVSEDVLWDEVRLACRRPFDLAGPCLLRPMLFQIAPDDWHLLLCVHHIVVDGWSLGILAGEFALVYAALCAGTKAALPPLATRYVDFASWHRDYVSGGALTGQLAYWRERLAGARAVELPADAAARPDRAFSGDVVPVTVPAELVAALRRIGDDEGATLYMVLAAAWAIVLARWSGRRDVVWGTAIAGRTRTELEGLVGFFVNTLALRVDVPLAPGFRELLGRVREACVGAYANQDLPFEQLVREIRPDRDGFSRSPIIRHMLVLHNTPRRVVEPPGVRMDVLPVHTGTAKFELEIELSPAEDGGLAGFAEFSTDVLTASSARRLVAAVLAVARAGVAEPTRPVWDLPLTEATAPAPGGTGAQVLDRWMAPVPIGVVGELFLGGVVAGQGFTGRPALTAARFVPDPSGTGARLYATGDRARRTAEGLVEIVDAPEPVAETAGAGATGLPETVVPAAGPAVGPRTEAERRVAEIWAELLGIDAGFDVHEDFFELGGHSLLAVRILHRIRAACQVELELADFFEAGTVANVAGLVDAAAPARPVAAIPRLDRSRFRAPTTPDVTKGENADD